MIKNKTAILLIGLVVIIIISVSVSLFQVIQESKKEALLKEEEAIKYQQEVALKWMKAKTNPNFKFELYEHVVDGLTPRKSTVYHEWSIEIFAQNNPKIAVISINPHNFSIDLSEFGCYEKSIDCKITMILDHKPESALKIEINNEPDSGLKFITYNSQEHNDLSEQYMREVVLNSSHIELIVERSDYPTVHLNYLTDGIVDPIEHGFLV